MTKNLLISQIVLISNVYNVIVIVGIEPNILFFGQTERARTGAMRQLVGNRRLRKPHHTHYSLQFGDMGGQKQQQKKLSSKILRLNFILFYSGAGLVFFNPKHIKLFIENGIH